MLAMLQVNIAIGILYWVLPPARYRERLFRNICESFKSRPGASAETLMLIGDLLRNQEFGESYHKVSNWRRALPELYDQELENTSAGWFPRAVPPASNTSERKIRERLGAWLRTLPLSYRWFRSNLDKYTIFVVATILPIIFLWHIAAHPLQAVDTWFGIYLSLAVGQVFAVVNVLSGLRMVRVHSGSFDTALEHVVTTVEQAGAQREVEMPLEGANRLAEDG